MTVKQCVHRRVGRGKGMLLGFVGVAALALAGCGGDGDESPTSDEDASSETEEASADEDSSTDAEDDSPTREGEMSFVLIDPDIASAPALAAIADMEEEGFAVEIVEIAEPELAIEGMANGEYDIGGSSTSPALIAIEQGAPIRIVADVVGNQWGVYAAADVNECNDLDGKPFGIFSEGAVATAMVRQWVAAECDPGVSPQYLVIGGSDVRAQALLNGEVDGTALTVSDVVTLEAEGADMNELIDFAQGLPELKPQTIYANQSFLQERGDVAQAFISALALQHQRINDDPAYLVGLVETYLPDFVDDTLEESARLYSERQLFDTTALNEFNLQGTIDFFIEAGVIAEGMTVDDAADLSYVSAVND